MDLPYNWDFIQNNISSEKLAELRRRFMEEWRSGRYTKKQMMERYRMSERTFRNTIKKYADAKELEDYKDKPRALNNPHRKFTREELKVRFANFVEDMRAAGRNLSPPKLNAQKKKIFGIRPGVRKIKASEVKPEEFQRPPEHGKCFYIDTGACFIGDKTQIPFQPIYDEFNSELVVLVAGMSCNHTLSLKALEELCRLYPYTAFQIRSDGGKESDNNLVNDFFVKKDISWIKVSKPWDNPFAERGIRTIKHEYMNHVWIGNFSEFEELSEIIKLHYNECRPHQSFDNKTPAEVRIAATGNNQDYSPSRELEKWDAFYWSILGRTKPATC